MDRHREALDMALRIVTAEGLSALTMQRLADDLGWSVGSVYRSFPSKGALIAELQREALDIVHASLQLSQHHVDAALATRGPADPAFAALARAAAAARFWVGAEAVFPREIALSRRLFTEPDSTMEEADGARVIPAGLRLLDVASRLLDDAVAEAAVVPGRNLDRAIILIAGTTGVLLTSGLTRWDDEWFDGRRLAWALVQDLFVAWGADRVHLDRVESLLASLSEHGLLVPEIRT